VLAQTVVGTDMLPLLFPLAAGLARIDPLGIGLNIAPDYAGYGQTERPRAVFTPSARSPAQSSGSAPPGA
jgi:hypothetical protein